MKLLSFVLSACMMSGLVLLLWTIDVVRQTPQIPSQVPDVNYSGIKLPKKKHNHIDDFCIPYTVSPRYMSVEGNGVHRYTSASPEGLVFQRR